LTTHFKSEIFINVFICFNISENSLGVKTTTVSLEAYEALLRIKRPGESFSDVILRLVCGLMDLAGIWHDINDTEIEDFLKEIRRVWKEWKLPAKE